MTTYRLDPPLSQCGTLVEIAELLGLSDAQALYNLRERWPDEFPDPLRTVCHAQLYYIPAVEHFHYQHGYGYGIPRRDRR